MAVVPSGAAQFLARYGNQTIQCNQYTLAKLGVDKSNCFLKIADYMVSCVPYQFGFKKSYFIASLSKQEMFFFQKYVNKMVGLSIGFARRSGKAKDLVKFFIHCNLDAINPIQGNDNAGIFEVEHKVTPDQLVITLGSFIDSQEKIKILYEEYGKTAVKMTSEAAKIMGYNLYALISEINSGSKRIQVYMLSSKTIEHLEAAGGNIKAPGSQVVYQLFFKKYRVSLPGVVQKCVILPNGIIKTDSSLSCSPELVEILDDYWTAPKPKPSIEDILNGSDY